MNVGLIGAPSSADFFAGPAYTGLATVAYKIVSADKSTLQDWTTTGVTELEAGSGLYGVAWGSAFFGTTLGVTQVQGAKIRWRTAPGANVVSEDLYICYPADGALSVIAGYIDTEVAAIKAKTDNLPADPADASDLAAALSIVTTALSAIQTKTDGLPVDPADQSALAALIASAQASLDTLTTRLTNTRATNLDNLDVAVSTRATPADVDVQVEADITGVNTKLDTLQDTADAIRATTDALPLVEAAS